MHDLLGMHVPRADWANKAASVSESPRKDHEHSASSQGPADELKSLLLVGVGHVRSNPHRAGKQRLDLCDRHAVLLTFRAIIRVPIETIHTP